MAKKVVPPELTGILKMRVNQYEAEDICRASGMRLPTVWEFALVSQSMGAQGIRETKKDGYCPIMGTDTAGNPEHFYFNREGYNRPAGAFAASMISSMLLS